MIEESVAINAGIERVWDLFTDLPSWRSWNTVVTVLSRGKAGRITKGASYTFLIPRLAFLLPLKPFAEEVVPGEKIVLSGRTFGIGARHEFFFAGNEAETAVTSRETFTGIAPAFSCWPLIEKRIRRATVGMLRDLKGAAETRTEQ